MRTRPSARRQSGDMKTSSVGMFGTNSTPFSFSSEPPTHTDSGAMPMVTSVPGPW